VKKNHLTANLNNNGVTLMKKTKTISTLLFLTLATLTQAQNANEQAGDLAAVYLNQPVPLVAGNAALVGATLARPPLLKGEVSATVTGVPTFTAVGANTFSSLNITLAIQAGHPGYPAGTTTAQMEAAPISDDHYVIEFTSGPFCGLVKQVTAFGATGTTGSDVTVAGNLPTIDAGTRFVLRKDLTLGYLFGVGDTKVGDYSYLNKSGLQSGNSSGSADVVSVINSAGAWAKYFYRYNVGWKPSSDRSGSDRQYVRVPLGTGVLISPILSKTIGLSGEYRGTRSRVSLLNTVTIVGNPYPSATTLANTDLATYLTKSDRATSADQLRFLEDGKFVNYYARAGTGATSPSGIAYMGFKPTVNKDATSVDSIKTIPAGGAVIVQRIGAVHDLAFQTQYLAQ
jgi:hypothetical protein